MTVSVLPVTGARPNFPKAAPVLRAQAERGVNSTAAATLAASKLGIRVAHVEAGLLGDGHAGERIAAIIGDRL